MASIIGGRPRLLTQALARQDPCTFFANDSPAHADSQFLTSETIRCPVLICLTCRLENDKKRKSGREDQTYGMPSDCVLVTRHPKTRSDTTSSTTGNTERNTPLKQNTTMLLTIF